MKKMVIAWTSLDFSILHGFRLENPLNTAFHGQYYCFFFFSSALSQPGDIPVKASSDSEQPSDSRVSATCGSELGQMDEATAGPIMEISEPKGPSGMLHTSQILAEKIPTLEVVAKAVITPRFV